MKPIHDKRAKVAVELELLLGSQSRSSCFSRADPVLDTDWWFGAGGMGDRRLAQRGLFEQLRRTQNCH